MLSDEHIWCVCTHDDEWAVALSDKRCCFGCGADFIVYFMFFEVLAVNWAHN